MMLTETSKSVLRHAKQTKFQIQSLLYHIIITFEKKFFSNIVAEYSVVNYMFKVNNRSSRTRCEICSKLTIKTPERRQWRRSSVFPAIIHLFKINNRTTRRKWEMCSKLTIKTPEWRHWRLSDVFIFNFEHISHLFPVFLLLTLSK